MRKLNSRMFRAVPALIGLALAAAALPGIAKPTDIQVEMTADVKAILDSATPAVKQALTKAVATGSAFVNLWLMNKDFYSLEDDASARLWPKTVGRLMSMTGPDWSDISEKWEYQFALDENTSGQLIACPRATLKNIATANGVSMLTYAVPVAGVQTVRWKSPKAEYIDATKGGATYLIELLIGADSRISKVTTDPKSRPLALPYVIKYQTDNLATHLYQTAHWNLTNVNHELEPHLKKLIFDLKNLKTVCAKNSGEVNGF